MKIKCWCCFLIDGLAARLETERNGDLALYASLCYICSGNLEKLVENWVQNTENSNSPLALQVGVACSCILSVLVSLAFVFFFLTQIPRGLWLFVLYPLAVVEMMY